MSNRSLDTMLTRASWQFYKDIAIFIWSFAIVCALLFGVTWAFLLMLVPGLLIGFVGFHSFKHQQFYFYYNLGYTKWKLIKYSFLINAVAGFLGFGVVYLFIFVIRGVF